MLAALLVLAAVLPSPHGIAPCALNVVLPRTWRSLLTLPDLSLTPPRAALLLLALLLRLLLLRLQGQHGYFVSGIVRHHLEHTSHFSAEQKRQVLRLVNLLSAYAVHDPATGYCQG